MRRLMVFGFLLCGVAHGALYFDGSSDYVTITDHADFDFSGAFTVALWVNPDTVDALDYVVYHTDLTEGYLLFQSTTDSGLWFWRIDIGGTAKLCQSDVAPTGNWQHLCGVRDGSGNMTLYVDGVAQADTEVNAGAMSPPGNLIFSWSQELNGYLQDVAIWDTALSQTEITLLASSKMARVPLMIQRSNLIGYWPLDDQPAGTAANGDTVYDISGSSNQHNGTVTSSSNWSGGILSYAHFLKPPWKRSVRLASANPMRGYWPERRFFPVR